MFCNDNDFTFSNPAILLDLDSLHYEKNTHFDSIIELNHIGESDLINTITSIVKSNENRSCHNLVSLGDINLLISIYSACEFSKSLVFVQNEDDFKDVINNYINRFNEEIDNLLETIHNDLVIVDSNGVITKVSSTFEEMYGIPSSEALGKTVYEMEKNKIFNPSAAIPVFRDGSPLTQIQLTNTGKQLMVTAIPLKGPDGKIEKVVSYTKNLTEYEKLKKEYEELSKVTQKYRCELEALREKDQVVPDIILESPLSKNILNTICKISQFDANVLLTGESGVGKSLFAKLIHSKSQKSRGPFIEINCGAIPENLMESELFGYEKGAFTGADAKGKLGLIELAHNGSLFLDEIGELPLSLQVKILNVIQDKKVMRIGGTEEIRVDFRLIAATNKNLEALMQNKLFREDLYYRLNVIKIEVPSLKDRKEDIFPLITHFMNKMCDKYNISRALSNSTIDILLQYNWPGNVRELENIIERLVITSDSFMITEDMLPSVMKNDTVFIIKDKANLTLKEILETVEKKIVLDSYTKNKTSIKVAQDLGISQSSASEKIIKHTNQNKRNMGCAIPNNE